jgi:BirA family biotin operon repressor/biotin-[acetyl-CoA-carboxylase] ligase
MTTKGQLLNYLKINKDSWISGESVSKELNVSRAAISKHISSLKKAGYKIDSLKGKGYLYKKSDLLLPDEIHEDLKTKVMGRDVVFFDETDSTNIRAKDLAENGAVEGTLVIAESQSKGRGRKGRSWHTDKGEGIFLSLILRPKLTPSEVAIITLMTAVAMVEALKQVTDALPRIKWPNDLLINGKKICGILTELSTEMDAVNYIIVGLGININSKKENFPEEIKDIATSLHMETGEEYSRKDITKRFLESFEKYYNILNKRGFETILTAWKKNSDTIGRDVEIDIFDRQITGVVEDIESSGVLRVSTDDGRIERIISGDVHFV